MTQPNAMEDVLDVFCPMHLALDADGTILHCGPTLTKLRDEDIKGRGFLDVFNLRRPRHVHEFSELQKHCGTNLRLRFRKEPFSEFKGVMVRPHGWDGYVVNLSFGISIVDGVREYALTSADFAATDLTIEMLYLVEAKSAAMEASRKLNLRLQGAMIAAEEQAFTDTLTGLKNRRALNHILNRHAQWEMPFSIMQIDLDWFKAVNDTFGHAAGDHVLQTVARVMVEETRENDTVARLGGDEFCIVLPETHDENIIRRIADRIIARLSEPIPFQGDACKISCSIGVSLFDPIGKACVDKVIDDGDVALYASKRAGRAQVTFYSPDLRTSEDDAAPLDRAMP